jgi:Effector Associated Constant Component 1
VTDSRETARLEIRVVDPDADASRLDELTSRLRRELLQLDVQGVERASTGPAPPGTRAGEVAEIGTLVVTLTTTPALLTSLVVALRAWLGSKSKRSATVTGPEGSIVLTGLSSSDQQRLIDAFVASHSGAEAP